MPTLEEQAAPKPVEKPAEPEVAKGGPYVYRPLDPSRNEIRILVLYTSLEDKDPVKCELVHIGIDDDIRVLAGRTKFAAGLKIFTTLSYTWDETENPEKITLEGHQFSITKNLYSALKNLRNLNRQAATPDKVSPSFWWIDAICINQEEDVLERNSQVVLMTRIYERCYGVHIWLREEADDSSSAMDLITKMTEYKGPQGLAESKAVYPDHTFEQKTRHWKVLTALFRKPWWERCWVRQKIAVPKYVTINCGEKCCRFDQVTATADMLVRVNEALGFEPA